MSPRDVVQRAPPAKAPAGARHKPAVKGKKAAKAVHATKGTLSVRIVSASIFQVHGLETAPLPDAGRLFDVTLKLAGSRTKPRRLAKRTATPAPLHLAPGTYQIGVQENLSGGAFQKYPDGACVAVVEAGKTTHAVVVLASDTLRAVAAPCGFHIGVKVGPQDGTPAALYVTTMLTVQYEFNVVASGLFWESVQSSPPLPASPLSAPLFHEPDLGTLQAKLAANGWRNTDGSFESRLWDVMSAVAPYHVEIMPTPLTWFTTGQKPSWFAVGLPALQPAPHPLPSTSAIMVDHVKAMMLYTKRVQGPSPVNAWVAVNEVFDDTGDAAFLEFWGGLASTARDRARVRARMVKSYLDVAHGVDPKALLLVNDFHQEFYPPPPVRKKGKRAAAVSAMRKVFDKAMTFHALMVDVMKHPGGLRGRVGAGYQMHFEQGPEYLAQPALYRTALRTGIRKLQRLGLRVVITEMVVKVNGVPDDPATYAARNYGADHTNACWAKQARVYRDMVRTYLLEPGCDTVVFWGLVDEAEDENMDYYGHLFDTTAAGTQGVYPTGTGLLRKPAYFAVLNALIEGGYGRHGEKRVPNWQRRFRPG